MNDQHFYHGYQSQNQIIKEGYAYAISTIWFRQFQNAMKNINGVDISKIGEIKNKNISDNLHEINTNFDGYLVPQQHSTTFQRVYSLRSDAIYGQDYDIVSIDVWKFLKMYYNADYDIVVFVTKLLPNLTKYFTCENLDAGLCICLDVINLIMVIIQKDDKSLMNALKLPACPSLELVKFRTYLFAMTAHKLESIKFINQGHLYYDGKKVPFKGNKTLKDMGITKDMQIILSCINMTMADVDVEEEIETEGDEQQIEQNLRTKQEFLEILKLNLNQQSTEQLTLKSIQDIQQSLEENDFFQV
ncbi:unnamed protein product [Paramecium sonneborni]|uniref:DUSP domain-containing protein n=1 Tax=Paramecium sonneborni TaxID=65129 RepID=A0A8S1QRB1_9CILI|nr:unnamed protein product [Paramecium sonneborni]